VKPPGLPVHTYKKKKRKEEQQEGKISLFRDWVPVEIVLRGGKRENDNDEGVNPTKIYGKHICKYQNIFPCTTIIC
jgi:hypothetical protein